MIIEDEIQHSSCMVVVHDKLEPMAMQMNRNSSSGQGSSNYRGRNVNIVISQVTPRKLATN